MNNISQQSRKNNTNSSIFEESLETRYHYIKDCWFNRACQLRWQTRKFCTSDYCYEHGWNNRLEDCKWVWENCEPTTPTYAVNLNFDYLCSPQIVSAARKKFFKNLESEVEITGYVWRLHFLDFTPHFWTTISCNDIRFSSHVKSSWIRALESIKHPAPTKSRIYCMPTKDWRGSIWYMFQLSSEGGTTPRILQSRECPPQVKKQRWAYWDCK